MSENHWERKQRHLNEDHKFRTEQRKRDIEILKGKFRIDEGRDAIERLEDEISRRERSERWKALLDDMQREKAFALERISACSLPWRDQWSERLGSIDLTRSGADAELKKLREGVERERNFWSGKAFTLPARPEWAKRLIGTGGGLEKLRDEVEREKNLWSGTGTAFQRRWEQEQNDRERARQLIVDNLALIVSTLGLLISTYELIRLYKST